MNLGLGINLGSQRRATGITPTYVWMGSTLAAAPVLGGVPANSTYINVTDTTYVTRGGVKMKAAAPGTSGSDNGGFASVPFWQQANEFHSVDFELTAGTWQVGFIMSGSGAGGNMLMVDNPLGAATTRQTIALTGAASSLSNTSGTTYTNVGTAIAGAVEGMTLVSAQVTDLGGGVGVLRVYANAVASNISAIALRAP